MESRPVAGVGQHLRVGSDGTLLYSTPYRMINKCQSGGLRSTLPYGGTEEGNWPPVPD